MAMRRSVYGVLHPDWILVGMGVGVGLQVLGWFTGIGLLGGLPGFFIMGVLIGWASPGNTVIEPGIAAFGIAVIGFIFDHLLLTIIGIGFVLGIGYGLVGLVLGMLGGWVGERLSGV